MGERFAVIAGIGQTEFSKNSGRSELQLAAEAATAALHDAGLSPQDLDGTVTYTLDSNDEVELARTLGIPELNFTARTRGGGLSGMGTIQLATAAIRSHAANAILVYRAFNERSGRRFGQPAHQARGGRWNWYQPYGLTTPAEVYALTFQRYMSRYRLTNEDFGLYTVAARKYAATNPNAWFYNRPITLADHQHSRWVVEPILRLLDCCQESDGGVAMIITGNEPLGGLANPGVRIAAASQAHLASGEEMFNYYQADLADMPEARALARQLFGAAGGSPADVDVAMLYENFSPIVFLQLEALGFCGPGEARDFIADGQIDLHGQTPTNTNGGLLGEAYIHGMNLLTEAVRQLRGVAANQVSGAERALVSASRSGVILEKL